ncbi:aldo/keto reductase [Natronobiforma cellulositropha]|uniref:aldo/keto reductase n=1 Tax=Natronobiforma cellulositropha TaxID=1679076 RepID=UPI0021D5FFB8|nr:aldo/keto reductase [Natronobiforma cellulositropha]
MLPELPRIGLGTASRGDRHRWADRVERALERGYRHLDTAQVYGNEAYVGEGLERSSVPREEVFLATKTVHVDVPGPTRTDLVDSVEASLERLRTDYVDLLYVHWPTGVYDPELTLGVFDDLRDDGLIRHVGVSNFELDDLETAREFLDAPIVANQVECHPLLPQEHLRAAALEDDHWLVAYCPLARGEVFDVPEVRAVARKHDASPAQVSLAWLCSKPNVAAIPRASSDAHMRENLAATDVALDDEDLELLDAIERRYRVIDRDYASWKD